MMENIALLNNNYLRGENIEEPAVRKQRIHSGRYRNNPALVDLVAEGGESLFRYLKSLNLSSEPNLLVLPSNHHYFYDEEDLKDVRTLINLRKLNLIRDPEKFLQNLSKILPEGMNFIGCFSEDNNYNWEGFFSGLSLRFVNFLDSKTDNRMNKKDVSDLLGKYGFKVIDMTEINGLTYFYSRNIRKPVEIRA
jgi:hypothetical protein